MRVEMLRRRLDGFATSISRLVFQFEVGNVLTLPMMLEKLHRILAIFGSIIKVGVIAKKEDK